MQPSNPIELAVFNNLLGAIAEEMCAIVERTAYTTFVKETHDFGAGIATPDGVFFAYPRKSGVTSFLGLHLGDALKRFETGSRATSSSPTIRISTGALVTHLPDLTLSRAGLRRGRARRLLLGLHPFLRHRRPGARQHRAVERRDLPGRAARPADEALPRRHAEHDLSRSSGRTSASRIRSGATSRR